MQHLLRFSLAVVNWICKDVCVPCPNVQSLPQIKIGMFAEYDMGINGPASQIAGFRINGLITKISSLKRIWLGFLLTASIELQVACQVFAVHYF